MFTLLLALIYICFISLGLPDSLLGSAWPILHQDIGVPVSYAGIVSMIITLGTVLSSLMSDRLVRRLGTAYITALSIGLTAISLFGFSLSSAYWMLLLWAIPYGLGAGAVDAVLNNYVALHYKAQHMSWLHCFWGVGASISPYIMSFALLRLDSWNKGYLIVAIIQIILSVIVFLNIPLWKKCADNDYEIGDRKQTKSPSIKEIITMNGALTCLFSFFSYCGLELTTSLWASSYLVQTKGINEEIASAFASFFFLGITVGRGIGGFLAMKINDTKLIRLGLCIVALGIILIMIPTSSVLYLIGFVIIGLGCAPIYPCIIHMTPMIFGKEVSQSMIGFQMAFAYIGFCILPPLFGFIAEWTTISILPWYLFALLAITEIMHETTVKKTKIM